MKRFNKLTAWLLTVVMLITMLPGLTVSVSAADSTTYNFSETPSPLTINSSNLSTYDGATITGELTLDLKSDILVIDGVTVNLTIENLTLKTTGATTSGYSPIDLRNNATLNLTVKGTNTLSAEYHAAGIHVPDGCTLNITAESTGTLTVNGGNGYGGGAGIGADGNGYIESYGSTTQTCGTINIAGGTIIATGGTHYIGGVHATAGGAGIGGSSTESKENPTIANTGKITISGGNVTATGGGQSAGIGGGECGYVESISITGGTVTAAAEVGAAIGTGQDGTNGIDIACGDKMKISITGGTVTADGNIGYGEVLVGSSMTGGSVTIGTNASVVLTDGHKIDHGDASNYAIIPVTLNVYDGRLTDTAEWVTMEATQGGSRVGGAGVELAVSDYHGIAKVNFVVPAANATGATDFTVTGDSFSVTGSATLTTSGVTVNCGQQLYPVTLAFLDDTKFASNTDYNVNENGLTVTSGVSAPADGTIMDTLPTTIKYHSASMGTMVVWLAAGTYNISVRSSWLNDGAAMEKEITVTGSATLVMLDNSAADTVGTLDLSYGPIKFYKDGDAYKVDYYTAENPYSGENSTVTTATVLVSAPFVVTQSNSDTTATTNTITVTDWGTAVPLDLTIDGLNIETSTLLVKDNNASYIDINGSAVNLNLSGSSSLKSTYYGKDDFTAALVRVDGTSSLTIDGSGSLSVDTYAYALGAAIGGDAYSEVGTITIEVGTVNANGGTGAAIGTGYGGSTPGKGHAVITITGGTVNANHYSGFGTAIGAGSSDGSNANTASVTITGGEVNATGIIGAYRGSAIVEISGGTVNATANTAKATIGGEAYYNEAGENVSVIISGGTVDATNTGSGPAIGGLGYSEYYSSAEEDTGNSVTITGGIVTATNNSATAAAIGASSGHYFNKTDVTINGGLVTATNSAEGGVAIGGGYTTSATYTNPYTYTNVTITGGSVNGEVWAYSDANTNTGATNGSSSVYKITADLSSTVGTDAEVTSASITGNTSYVFKDVYTDASGKIYLWLPAKATDAEFGGVIYSGTPNADNNATFTRVVKLNEVQASSVTDTTATITASADPGATVYYLASMVSFANGAALATAAGAKSVTADSSGNVTINLTGLDPNTTYKYYLTSMLGTSYSTVESVHVITNKPDISKATISDIDDQTYSGSAITPDVTVTYNGTSLTKDEHYTLDYSNNTNAGAATVTIKGVDSGGYSGTATKTFEITAKILMDTTVTLDKYSDTYTGEDLTPTVTVADGSALTADDYTTAWEPSEIINAGTYTLTVTGKNNYQGTVTKKFTINKAPAVVTPAPTARAGLVYNGSAQELVEAGATSDGTMQYRLSSTDFSTNIPKGTDAGNYKVYYKVVGDSNHDDSTEGSVTVSIGQATATADSMIKASGNLVKRGTSTVTLPALPDDVASYGAPIANNTEITSVMAINGILTITGSDSVTVGDSYTVTVPVQGAKNYSNYDITVTLTGTDKLAQTITAADVTATYGDSGKRITASTSGDGEITYAVTAGADVIDVDYHNGNIIILKAGTATVTVKANETNTYAEATKAVSVTISKASVTNNGDDTEITYGGSTYDMSGMFTRDNNAGEAFYTIADGGTGAGTIDGSALTITKAGTIEIKLTTEATDNYAEGEATATLTVAKGTGEGSVTMADWIYNGTASEPDAKSATNGTGNMSYLYKVKDADDSTYSSDKPSNVGNYTIKAIFAETDLYNEVVKTADFTIVKATPSYEVPANLTATYGQTLADVSLPTGFAWQDESTATVGNAGNNTFKVTYTPSDTNNYNVVNGIDVPVAVAKKKIDSAIVLTAPVKNTAPQTEITGTGYTAAVVWSPEVTDKFGYNKEYTATITITTDDNHTVEGIAADGYTVEGAKTVTNDENSNVITVAYKKTGARRYSSSGNASNTITTTNKNDNDAAANTTTDETTGTTTEVTTGADGSTTTVETRKDGTVTTTEKDSEGNKTVTTEKADGTVITEETKKDGTTVRTETTASGETTAEVRAEGETKVIIPVENAEDVYEVVVTDASGNETVITDFETVDNGIAITTSGNASVSVSKGSKKEFVDVHPVDHWSEESVDYVYIRGLMKGTSENHFSPDAALTRAMLVTVLYRLESEPRVSGITSFADLEKGGYYLDAVCWAQVNGIVNGVSETEFAPNENITREQIAAILYRYAVYKGMDAVNLSENLSFADADEISEYAISALNWAAQAGLIKGHENNTVRPLNNATRAEAAAILERFIKANK